MRRFLVLLVVVAAAVGVAAFQVPSPAATVNGSAISDQTLDADLSAIAGSAGYQCYLQAVLTLGGQSTAGLFPITGVGATTSDPASYNTNFVRTWLVELMGDQLTAQVLADRHLAVTPSDLAVGKASLRQQMTAAFRDDEEETDSSCGTTGTALLASLPAGFRTEQVRAQTERDVLAAHEAGYGLDEASLQRYYSAHRSTFDTICVSYVLFDSQSAATAAQASVEGGTPIAQTGTLTKLGCAVQRAITSLPASVTSLPVGKVSAPVSAGTSTGRYVLLEVTSRTATPFGSARTVVEQAVLSAGSTKADDLVTAASKQAAVTADPRYGQVRPRTIVLAPPSSPPAGTLLNPTANLPASTAAAGSSPSGAASG